MIALVSEEAHWAMYGVEEKPELQFFFSFLLSGDHQDIPEDRASEDCRLPELEWPFKIMCLDFLSLQNMKGNF